MTHHRFPDLCSAIKTLLILSALALTAQASAECTPAGLTRLYEMKTFKPAEVACLPDGPLGMMIGQGAVVYSNKAVYSGRFSYQHVSLNQLIRTLTGKFGDKAAVFAPPRNNMTAYGIPLPARMKRTFMDLPAVVRDALQLIVYVSYNKDTDKSDVIFGVYVDTSQ